MKRYTVRERNIIRNAMDAAGYGCIFPKTSPGYKAWRELKREIAKFKKELRKSGALRKGERVKYWIDSNTEWYPEYQ